MAKKIITVKLYLSELVFDIQNKTYITGRSRADGDNFEQVANMQVNGDDENQEQVLRSITNAVASLRVRLGDYITETKIDLAADNRQLSDKDNVLLTLAMPANYNTNTRDQVASGCHRYIVASAIAEWFTMTDKADAADYAAMATVAAADIREAISKRARPRRMVFLAGQWQETDASLQPSAGDGSGHYTATITPSASEVHIKALPDGPAVQAVVRQCMADIGYTIDDGAEDDIAASVSVAGICSLSWRETAAGRKLRITGTAKGETTVTLYSSHNPAVKADVAVSVAATSPGAISGGAISAGDITSDITSDIRQLG